MAQSAPVLNQTASANNSPTTITIPAGALIGDMMVLAVVTAATASPSVPAGWATQTNQSFASNSIGYAIVCTRRAVSGDPGSTVTLPAGTVAAQLTTWSNVGADPIVAGTPTATNTTLTGGTGYPVTAASLTTADANCTVVDLFFGLGSVLSTTTTTDVPTLTLPSTATQAATTGDTSAASSYWWAIGSSYQAQAAAGASTAETATYTPYYTSYTNAAGVCGVQLALPPIQAPSAPTLNSPANASYEDMSGSPTFTWTYNPTQSDGAQNAIAIRRKISGAPSYSYWNASTSAWQSTIVWNSYTTGTYTFPAGAWANGNIYNWSVATQESTQNLQGTFASDFTVTAQAVPSVSITAPTGTIATTTPTVTATATVASGATVTGYRLVVYTAAQVAAPGFTPGGTPNVYDSGTVPWTQTAITQQTSGLSNNVTYTPYMQVTETGAETSAWTAGTSFSVSFDPPAQPTVTAAAGADPVTGCPVITVTVNGHDNLLSAADASFEGSLGTWTAGANTTVVGETGEALDGTESLGLIATTTGNVSATTGTYTI